MQTTKTEGQTLEAAPESFDDFELSTFGALCLFNSTCFAVDAKFDRTTIILVSVDLYDPDAANEEDVWTAVPVDGLSERGKTAAQKALKRSTEDREFKIDLCDKDCECRLTGKWGPWTAPHTIDIFGGFSIPNPGGQPKKLRYRANGTVSVKTRMQSGGCYRIEV